MSTLNDMPKGWYEREEDDWTPMKGLVRGVIWTGLATAVMTGLFCWAAYLVPTVIHQWFLQPAIGFIVISILMSIMIHTAGQTGGWVTLVVTILSVMVIVSKHIVFAVHGYPTMSDPIVGSYWLKPSVVLMGNLTSWIGMTGAVLMCKDGNSILSPVADLLMTSPITGRRM